MTRCKHERGNIQQFTEICLDCGHNIYETDEEYEKSLSEEVASLKREVNKKRIVARIDDLESEKARLLRELRGDYDDDRGY